MKKWVQMLLCLLVSAGIWFIHNLSQSYVSIVSVPVVAESNLDGHSSRSSTDATVTAQVRASGFRQAALSRRFRRPVVVQFSPDDLRSLGGDIFSPTTSDLYKYTSAIFGEGVTIETFISEPPKFVFPEATHKKVPVQKVHSITFAPQYMSANGMELQPDSVVVYGETSRLENISYVLTKPLELKNLRSSAHGKVKLDLPSGVRLSTDEVIYSMEVVRYVELSSEVRIETRNVPAGVEFTVLPSTASVVLRCVFPVSADPFESMTFYIDYDEFASSITGRCLARCSGQPPTVLDYSVEPEVFDCVVTER